MRLRPDPTVTPADLERGKNALVGAQVAIALLGSVAGCALNSWLHQLVPRDSLGALFSKRLFWSTVLSSLGALSAGYLVQQWPGVDKAQAYSIAFVAAGAAGFVSSHYLTRVPEPRSDVK